MYSVRLIASVFGMLWIMASARPAGAVVIELDTTETGCSGITGAVVACPVPGGAHVMTVTWRFDQAVSALNAYDLSIRWDTEELTLLGSTAIFPDGGSPEPFLEAPSDPANSIASALSLVALPTTELFSVTFELMAQPGGDGQPDLEWFANLPGLSPGSVVLDNLQGASIDFWTEPTPIPMLPTAVGLLPLVMGLAGALLISRR